MDKLTRFLIACIVIVAIGLGAVWFFQHKSNAVASLPFVGHKAKPSAPAYNINETALASNMNSYITSANNSNVDMSISLVDLQTGKQYHYGDNDSFIAASVGKLITTTTFLHKVEQGQASLQDNVEGDTAQDQIQKMLVNSDNTAWHAMEDDVTLGAEQSYADSQGWTSYQSSSNYLSSSNVANLLQKLWNKQLLNASDTNLVLGYMKQANYRQYIVAAIPGDVTVYHKVGFLSDRLHDAAIIQKGGRSYILVIFSATKDGGSYDFDAGASTFVQITDSTLQTFFGITGNPPASSSTASSDGD